MNCCNCYRTAWVIAVSLVLTAVARAADPATPVSSTNAPATPAQTNVMDKKLPADEAGWKQRLTPEQYRILRQKGTERAFTGAYWNHHDSGTYLCAGCGLELFTSTNKFDSGCGWPSYTQPLAKDRVAESQDHSLGMSRVEVTCSRCGGHLGHVFEDGPAPTGLRYCINSGAITFQKQPATPTPPPKKKDK